MSDEERRRSALALRGISDIGPGMTDRATGDLVADLATAVGLRARCRWPELFCRIAELIEREPVTEADMAATRMIAEASRGNDPESNHIRADGILCDVLEGLGYVETVRAFEEMEKWYA